MPNEYSTVTPNLIELFILEGIFFCLFVFISSSTQDGLLRYKSLERERSKMAAQL